MAKQTKNIYIVGRAGGESEERRGKREKRKEKREKRRVKRDE